MMKKLMLILLLVVPVFSYAGESQSHSASEKNSRPPEAIGSDWTKDIDWDKWHKEANKEQAYNLSKSSDSVQANSHWLQYRDLPTREEHSKKNKEANSRNNVTLFPRYEAHADQHPSIRPKHHSNDPYDVNRDGVKVIEIRW